jgi:midasin
MIRQNPNSIFRCACRLSFKTHQDLPQSRKMSGPDIKDPLTINLGRQIRVLLSKISAESPFTRSLQNWSSRSELLDTLSHILAVPSLTLHVAQIFRPILFDLCARWLLDNQNIDRKFIALCLLLEPHQELFP